ncbi:MAG: metallophosphoesterase family protein [Pseudomonadota bacterium]
MKAFDDQRFAVIADIHSNADALLAVLQDISDRRIDSIINLGDHLSGPMAARETADILTAIKMLSIRGNHDRWLVEQERASMSSIDGVAFDQLEASHLDWLQKLPPTLEVSDEIFACHGTPASDTSYWMESVTVNGDVVLRAAEEIAKEAEGIKASLLLCGHTHLGRRVDLLDGRTILNPGSVGCPAYSDNRPVQHMVQTGTSAASYAVVERSRAGWITSIHYVPYDPNRMIALAREAGHSRWVPRLTTGWVN